jgi:hypothetical protein
MRTLRILGVTRRYVLRLKETLSAGKAIIEAHDQRRCLKAGHGRAET